MAGIMFGAVVSATPELDPSTVEYILNQTEIIFKGKGGKRVPDANEIVTVIQHDPNTPKLVKTQLRLELGSSARIIDDQALKRAAKAANTLAAAPDSEKAPKKGKKVLATAKPAAKKPAPQADGTVAIKKVIKRDKKHAEADKAVLVGPAEAASSGEQKDAGVSKRKNPDTVTPPPAAKRAKRMMRELETGQVTSVSRDAKGLLALVGL